MLLSLAVGIAESLAIKAELVAEMVVGSRLVSPGILTDMGQRRPVIAVRGKTFRSSLEQPLARLAGSSRVLTHS